LGLPQQQKDPANQSILLGPLYDKAGNEISSTDLQYGYVTEYNSVGSVLGQNVQLGGLGTNIVLSCIIVSTP
jgi:hypothetical protein